MKEPLAFRLRPKTLDDIVGQKHLVSENGIIRKLINENHLFSLIFFGPPGIGKTTLATIIANELNKPYRLFNAVTGNKKDLDAIFFEAKMQGSLILIVDEVHRLNKDKQDLLLPHLEDGSIVLLGCTTANPYHAINPAIRSRCHLIELKALSIEDTKEALIRALKSEEGLNNEYTIDDKALNRLAEVAGGDIRYALNLLELSTFYSKDKHIDEETIKEYTKVAGSGYFGSDEGHYNLLSAFQKSIRGSDVNAALYYLSLLVQSGDVKSLTRRLLVIAYEDIGLANPALASRTLPACLAAEEVGFPEAALILGMHVIDLCLSAKSRTAADAIEKIVHYSEDHIYDVPDYLKLTPVGLTDDEKYHYDRYDAFHKIQYLPDELKDLDLFPSFARNRYEQQLSNIYEELKKVKRTNNLKDLYQK